jgi:iron only hydrogenase large subunit-like protein
MSHILSAESLNDYIAPSVACIKPIEPIPAEDPSLEHEVILDGTQKKPQGPTQISLTDCLACSGCVTTAEAVLVSLQSHSEVLNTLDSARGVAISESGQVEGLEDGERRIFVASVSPQTRASLAAVCGGGITEKQAGVMLERMLRGELAKGGKWGNGFTWVVDTNTARDACLVLGADEVLSQTSGPKPVITSSCPGWVCYAEKSHPYVLPHLSKVKSPQALLGTLLKTTISKRLGIPPSRIWHLAIMPCFDKKLEASREELMDTVWDPATGAGVRDVDCVITSKEIFTLAESRGIDFFGLSPDASNLQPQPKFLDPRIHQFLFPFYKARSPPREAGSSGGNLYFILQAVCSQNPGSQIQMARGRNVDVMEFSVMSADGEPIFKAARMYGFQNIQNLVRKMKPARPPTIPGARTSGVARPFGGGRRSAPAAGRSRTLDYSYIEVMACPGGCSRGGGQVNVDDPIVMERLGLETQPEPHHRKEWFGLVDEAYFSGDDMKTTTTNGDVDVAMTNGAEANGTPCVEAAENDGIVGGIFPSYIRDILAYWSESIGIDADKLALTSFREVVSDVGKEKTQAERVASLAGKIGGGW